jgi:hypothetical protein
MPAQVQGVLVAFRLVFVFETVVTELASVLFLHFMRPVRLQKSVGIVKGKGGLTEGGGGWRDDAGLTATLLRFQISLAF